MKALQTIKPNYRVFVVRKIIWCSISLFIAGLAGLVALPFVEQIQIEPSQYVLGWGVIFILAVGLTAFRQRIIYNKTVYELHPERVIVITGGIFSDHRVDLPLKNVTQVVMALPFVEHILYGTGSLTIKAAGTNLTETIFVSIDDPRRWYQYIGELLKKNGFAMQRGQILQQEKPGLVPSIVELSSPLVIGTGAFLFSLFPILETYLSALGEPELSELIAFAITGSEDLIDAQIEASIAALQTSALVMLGAVFLALVGGIFIYTIRVIDLTRRVYTLYDDIIDYEDGFLSEVRSFIPMENLADVELSQSLLRRLLGVSDIVISCQGAGAEIRFNSMYRAGGFKQRLEKRIEEKESQPDQQIDTAEFEFARTSPDIVDDPISNARPLTFRMSLPRAVIGLAASASVYLVLLGAVFVVSLIIEEFRFSSSLPIFGIVLLSNLGPVYIGDIIKTFGVSYKIDRKRVSYHYALFSRKTVEFTIDKLTAVDVRMSPLDRLMNTATIAFRSIGSREAIVFKHVAHGELASNLIIAKLGFDRSTPMQCIKSDFRVALLARGGNALFYFCMMTLAVGIIGMPLWGKWTLLIVGLSGSLLITLISYKSAYYKRNILELYDTFLRYSHGIFIKKHRYTSYAAIKSAAGMRYIGCESGLMNWFAGGNVVTSMAYVEKVWEVHHLVDTILERNLFDPDRTAHKLDTTVRFQVQPQRANKLTRLLLLSVIIVPLLLILPLTLAVLIARLKKTRYVIQARRLMVSRGLFFSQRHTILFGRIDHLTTSRNAFNKFYNNGTIGVRTVGSDGTDMVFEDVQNEHHIYEKIEGILPHKNSTDENR